MTAFTVLSALAGGALIGLASALLLFTHNRIAGISGIAAGILPPWGADTGWRLWFLAGLIISAPLYRLAGYAIPVQIDAPWVAMAAAGLLVGYGSRLGGGCTSGHGVCGIARLSVRSIVATLVFMLAAGLVVYLSRHVL
ncbi:YeeE/YedE family protein [Methylovulum miyakonense]|uniref:YeeE/YedE family protein n=1 Tax=Methylovulum miyakonense TaxID=645578 RepID=UPI00036C1BE7|nr:YeeE/YedE thiosulfate transporter family protein [Methylovulum miyakonense]